MEYIYWIVADLILSSISLHFFLCFPVSCLCLVYSMYLSLTVLFLLFIMFLSSCGQLTVKPVSWVFTSMCAFYSEKKILFVVTFENTLLSSCSCSMTSIPSFTNSLNNFNVLIFIHCFQIVLFLAC